MYPLAVNTLYYLLLFFHTYEPHATQVLSAVASSVEALYLTIYYLCYFIVTLITIFHRTMILLAAMALGIFAIIAIPSIIGFFVYYLACERRCPPREETTEMFSLA